MSDPSNLPTLLTPKQVAAWLGVSEMTLRRYVLSKGFPAPTSVGGQNRWHSDEIKRWLDVQPKAWPTTPAGSALRAPNGACLDRHLARLEREAAEAGAT